MAQCKHIPRKPRPAKEPDKNKTDGTGSFSGASEEVLFVRERKEPEYGVIQSVQDVQTA